MRRNSINMDERLTTMLVIKCVSRPQDKNVMHCWLSPNNFNLLLWLLAYLCDDCLHVWRNGVRRLATDPVVMRSSPATGHTRCALLVNQHK